MTLIVWSTSLHGWAIKTDFFVCFNVLKMLFYFQRMLAVARFLKKCDKRFKNTMKAILFSFPLAKYSLYTFFNGY